MRFGVSVPAALAGCLLLGGAGLVGGCAENRSSLFIGGLLYLDPTSTECTAEVTGDVQTLSRGTVDLTISQFGGYTALLLVGNQLVTQGNPNLLRTETSRIQIEGADVTVTPISGGGGGGSYRVPLSGFVNPDDTDAGLASIGATVVPSGVVDGAGDYLVEVTLFGKTLGGTAIESGKWSFPLTACEGCLAYCPADSIEIEIASCYPLGQDAGVDCRLYDGRTDFQGPVCQRVCRISP